MPLQPISDILFDTQVVSWMLGHVAMSEPNPEIDASGELFEKLAITSCQLHISSITITEALLSVTDDRRDGFLHNLYRAFNVNAYGRFTAIKTADMIIAKQKEFNELINEIRDGGQESARKIVHGDMKILGTGLYKQFDAVCSNDYGVLKLAKLFFPYSLKPSELIKLIDEQPHLFPMNQ